MLSEPSVRVLVRVRPPNEREVAAGFSSCVSVSDDARSLNLSSKHGGKTFTFDHVADAASSQEELFEQAGRKLTDACLKGFHCALIAYGQTGSGKTYRCDAPRNGL